jgi:hypothetical protein
MFLCSRLKVILHHDLAADNSGLIDAALFCHGRKSLLPVADGGSFLVLGEVP